MCQGWLEGYLLTGRHGFFSCYEAFIHIIDSMFNQHAKWLKARAHIPWRRPIASLNYLLTSHVWRQDHNGFSHQDPGFIDHRGEQESRTWCACILPPDANCLLSVADHCLRSRHYVNVIVAGKQPALQWLDMDAAIEALHRGRRHLGLGQQRPGRRAGCRDGLLRRRSDAGDAGGGGSAAATNLPDLKIRVVNVVDLMTLQPRERASARADAIAISMPSSPRTSRSCLPFTAYPVADSPADLSPDESRQSARARI